MLVVSDTHWNTPPDDHGLPVEEHSVVVHAGDVATEEALEEFTSDELYAVRGNADSRDLQRKLPATQVFSVDGVEFAVVHGHRQRTRQELTYLALEYDADVLVRGHSHVPEYTEDAVVVLNPGSPSRPRRGNPATYVELKVEGQSLSGGFVEASSGELVRGFETDFTVEDETTGDERS